MPRRGVGHYQGVAAIALPRRKHQPDPSMASDLPVKVTSSARHSVQSQVLYGADGLEARATAK